MEIGGALAQVGGTSKGDAEASDKGTDFEKAQADVQSQRNDGQVRLAYDISKGTLEVDPGRTDKPSYTMKATSGKDACMNEPSCADKPWEGPIPPGDYRLETSEIDDANLVVDIGRFMGGYGDWGDFRAPMKPVGDTETHGRDGFFLHGGVDPGSAGCIDVGGGLLGNDQTDRLQDDLHGDSDGTVEITVTAGE